MRLLLLLLAALSAFPDVAVGQTLAIPEIIRPREGERDVARPVRVRWNAVPGAVAYDLEIAQNTAFDPVWKIFNNLNEPFLEIFQTAMQTRHSVRVRTRNAAGQTGPWSAVRSFTTNNIFVENPLDAAILTLTFRAGSESAALQAGKHPDATSGLDLFLGEVERGPFPQPGAFEVRFVSVTGANLGQGTRFDFRGGNAAQTSGTTHAIRFQTRTIGDLVTIDHAIPGGLVAVIQDPNGGEFINATLTGWGNYIVPPSATVNQLVLQIQYSGTISTTEGDAPPSRALDVEVFPHPIVPGSSLRLHTRAPGETSYRIIDLLGREVAQYLAGWLPAGPHTLPLPKLTSGMYVLEVQSGAYREIRNLVAP